MCGGGVKTNAVDDHYYGLSRDLKLIVYNDGIQSINICNPGQTAFTNQDSVLKSSKVGTREKERDFLGFVMRVKSTAHDVL